MGTLGEHTTANGSETDRKDGFKKELDGIQEQITMLDDPATTADQWL